MDLSLTESKKPRLFYGYVVVGAGLFVMSVLWAAMQGFGVFLKPMAAEFDWSRAAVSGAYSICMFMFGVLGIFAGRLNDRLGARLLITICGVIFGLGFLMMLGVNSLWQLYLLYGSLIAGGLSGGYVPMASTVSHWFVKNRGLMTAIVLSGVGVGTVVGAPLASQLLAGYGWRTSYLIIGIIAVILIVSGGQFLRRDPAQKGLLPLGIKEARTLALKYGVEARTLSEASRTPQFWMLNLMGFCFGFSIMALMVHIVPYATDQGLSVSVASSILALLGGISIVGRVGMGGMSDRIGNKRALILGAILQSASLLGLLVSSQLWMLYLVAGVFGFAFGGLGTSPPPIAAELFGLKAHGGILGIISFSWCAGFAAGPIFAGRMFDVSSSYHLAFLVCAILSLIGLVLAALLRFPSKKLAPA